VASKNAADTAAAKKAAGDAAAAKGTVVVNASGAVLPDSSRTPGALNPDVTQSNIAATICVSGWTATVRPASSVTTALKQRQIAAGYTYQGDTNLSDYEEDHLIPLELGGAPADPSNLWPDPYNAPDGAKVKDTVENKLHDLVCARTLSLADAQHAIASSWWDAYQTYAAPAAAPAPQVVAPAPPPAPAPAPAVQDPGAGATAKCTDGSYSFSATHQGTCSHHGGVAIWYK
jgi:hypothetical protein